MEFSWGTLFYAAGIYGLIRYLTKPDPDSMKPNQVNWSPLESVVITLFIYFLGQFVGSFLIYGATMLFGLSSADALSWVSDDSIGQFLTIAAVDSIIVLLLIKFLKKRQNNLRTIGLKKYPTLRDGLFALGFYALYFICFLVVIQAATELIPALDINQKQEIGFESVTQWKLPFVFASLVLLPAFVEELLIRGFLYSGLRKRLPMIVAVLLTSTLFAIAHLQIGFGNKLLWVAAIDTFVLSVFLIILREKTGGLWSPIFLHGIKNSVAFVSLFILNIG